MPMVGLRVRGEPTETVHTTTRRHINESVISNSVYVPGHQHVVKKKKLVNDPWQTQKKGVQMSTFFESTLVNNKKSIFPQLLSKFTTNSCQIEPGFFEVDKTRCQMP